MDHEDALSDDSDASGFMFTIMSETDAADRVLGEQLVAGFIVQMAESGNDTMIAMGVGAALALQCFEHPHLTVDLLDAETDPTTISKLGVKVAIDIMDAHKVAHRVQRLVAGMPLSEVAEMVDNLKGGTRGSRADVVRRLESALLEKKVGK